MKQKPKASTPTTGQRGRKPGGGVLNQIDPQANAWSKGLTFHYGKAAVCPAAMQLVATRNFLTAIARRLKLDKAKLGEARIEVAKNLKEPGVDLEAGRYWWTQRYLDRELSKALTTAKATLTAALYKGDADFFRKLADTIEGVAEHAHAPVYPLHSAISVFATSGTLLTIGELCKQLEIHGQKLRPSGQSDESWQRRVRTVCKEVGFPLLPDKPGPKGKRS